MIAYPLFDLTSLVEVNLLLNEPQTFKQTCLLKYLPESLCAEYFGSLLLEYIVCLAPG
jgi:hypothetical protein